MHGRGELRWIRWRRGPRCRQGATDALKHRAGVVRQQGHEPLSWWGVAILHAVQRVVLPEVADEHSARENGSLRNVS
jgi:hypothetical protein